MRQGYKRVLMVALLLLTTGIIEQGCYQYRIGQKQGMGEASKIETKPRTVWNFWWGLQPPKLDAPECGDRGLAVTMVESNFLYDLVTIFSLGIASPKRVEYICDKPCTAAGVMSQPPAGK